MPDLASRMTSKPSAPGQRLDKWLWFARVMKSRTMAAELVGSGKVRVNRVRVVKPSHMLRQGDVLTVALRGQVRVLQVLSVGTRRGPPQEARLLYRLMGDKAETETKSGQGDDQTQTGRSARDGRGG
jgi:ribosome-associated heat shock protein Hsp15